MIKNLHKIMLPGMQGPCEGCGIIGIDRTKRAAEALTFMRKPSHGISVIGEL